MGLQDLRRKVFNDKVFGQDVQFVPAKESRFANISVEKKGYGDIRSSQKTLNLMWTISSPF